MPEKKRASRWTIFCYGLGDFAGQFVWTFIGSYLTIFYTDIVGLGPAVISAIMLGARIWDAVNDPIMGAIAENSRSRFGRFRPWIMFGAPILAVLSMFTFTHPFGGGTASGVLWAAGTYVVTGMIYTMVMIPYEALPAVITEDPGQIDYITTARMVGMYIGNLAVSGCTAGIALHFSASGATAADGHGYFMTAVIYSLVSIPLFVLVGSQCKEYVCPSTKTKFSLKGTIANNLKNKYLILLFILNGLTMLTMTVKSAMIPYYATYCLNNYAMAAAISSAPIAVSVGSALLAPIMSKKIGRKATIIFSSVVAIIGNLMIFLAPFDNLAMIMAGFCIGSYSYGGLASSMVPGAIDYMELKTGLRTDGTAYAFMGFGRKLGSAIAGSVGVSLLFAVGYQAGETVQATGTLTGIRAVLAFTPIISSLLTILCMVLFWDLSEKQEEENRMKLSELNAKK